MKIITKISAALALSMSMGANAGMILDWENTGVDFYSSWLDADTLRIEIDAGNITAGSGWDGAVDIDSIAINSNGTWSWVFATDIMLSGPGSFGGAIDGTGLNANGCQGLSLTKNHQCWTGSASLADNMFFDFTFGGSSILSSQTDSPHLKVRFLDANGDKKGSLLSADLTGVPPTNVPEPASLALLGIGLVGFAAASRRRRHLL